MTEKKSLIEQCYEQVFEPSNIEMAQLAGGALPSDKAWVTIDGIASPALSAVVTGYEYLDPITAVTASIGAHDDFANVSALLDTSNSSSDVN